MAQFKVGIQLRPQHCSMNQLREAWQEADALGADSIWTWDHFYPLYGAPDGPHFECWTMLGAMAATTSNAHIGALVTCNSYRNPDLLADMARTTDEISGGRTILGIGAGWFERDHAEFGYEFGTAPERLRALKTALPRIRERLGRLNPPAADLPIMVGGSGEKVTLRLAAEHAQLWNGFGPPDNFRHKNSVLDDWCAKIGRDPKEIDRTVMVGVDEIDEYQSFLDAGATHLIMVGDAPFDMGPLQQLLEYARD